MASRRRLAAHVLSVAILAACACELDRTPDLRPTRTGAFDRGDAPTAVIRYPISDLPWTCDSLVVRWEGDDGSGSPDEIVGYQLKLIALDFSQVPESQIIAMLLNPGICEANQLIPDHLVVPDSIAVTDSTFHACDWYPKPSALHTGETRLLHRETAVSAFAVRAFDVDQNVTPSDAFGLASEDADGNIVVLRGIQMSPADIYRLSLHERNTGYDRVFTLDPDETPASGLEVAAGYPLDFDWEAVRHPCGPEPAVETSFAIDIPDPECVECTDPAGQGGWSPWSAAGEVPFPIVFGEEAAGELHALHVRARDVALPTDDPPFAHIVLDVYGAGLQRPALWIDDYVQSGLDDCTHDAIVRPWMDGAVAPYVRAQEGMARWRVHLPGAVECSEGALPGHVPTLADLGRFRTLFWNVAALGSGSGLGQVTTHPSGPASETLTSYVRAGGNFIVWGRGTIGAMLGDAVYNDRPYIPAFPEFPLANFGPGTFLWDVMRFRTQFDRVGRGTSPILRSQCSGIVGMEATATALAEGYPPGVIDPTGYSTDPTNTVVTPRTAIWIDLWQGRQNPVGRIADAPVGSPPLHVAGMDTLYTYISNSWSYAEDGPNAIRDACGVSFLSRFEGEPIVIRYDDGIQGRVVWFGVPLWYFAESHDADIQLIMSKLIAWTLGEEDG